MTQPAVAILGASQDRTKYGNKSVRAHVAQGYRVYPVNPKAEMIEGLPAFASLADVPEGPLQRISVYLPPHIGLTLLDAISSRNPDEVWFNPGSESPELLAQARDMGLNVIQACSIIAVGMTPDELPDTSG